MKFTANREGFKKIGELLKITSSRFPNVKIFKNKNGKLSFSVSSMDISLTYSVDSVIDDDVAECVNAKKLIEVISNIEGRFTYDNGKITFGKNKVKLALIPVSDFLEQNTKVGEWQEINTGNFLEGIKSVSYASLKTTRDVLSGINVVKEAVVATDGMRLAERKIETNVNTILSHYAVDLILKCFGTDDNLRIATVKNRVVIASDTFVLDVSKINGEYPTYQGVIPKYSRYIELSSGEILKALKIIQIADDNLIPRVSFLFDKNSLIVSSESTDNQAKIEIDIDYSGEEMEKLFNLNYLKDVFENQAEKVKMYYSEDTLSGVVFGEYGEKIDVVMPIKRK